MRKRSNPTKMTELEAILKSMTPEQRAQFDAVNAAIAARVVAPAERKAMAKRAMFGGKRWRAFVAELQVRTQSAKSKKPK